MFKNLEETIQKLVEQLNITAWQDHDGQALDCADALLDVEKLRNGLYTETGGLSGQILPSALASKLGLARAYLKPASIVLIDELPNSILHGRAGKNLQSWLSEGRKHRTVLLVTYRDDFIRLASQVVTLQRGMQPVVKSAVFENAA